MSIQDVILFVSSTSKNCIPVVNFIGENNIPVKIVRLDTVEDRKSAANGKNFQIVSVPSLLVLYQDMNVQLFIGYDKIISWLNKILELQSQPSSQNKNTTESTTELYEMIEEPDSPPKKQKSTKKKTSVSKKSSKGSGLYGPEKKKSRRSENEIDIEYIDSGRKETQSTQGLMVGAQGMTSKKSRSRMGDVVSLAKQMERDRKATLGYDEKDLPVST